VSLCHYKSHITWPGSNTGRRVGKPATNHLIQGMVNLKWFIQLGHLVESCCGWGTGTVRELRERQRPQFEAFNWIRVKKVIDDTTMCVLHWSVKCNN
jgi:hypothetical protein